MVCRTLSAMFRVINMSEPQSLWTLQCTPPPPLYMLQPCLSVGTYCWTFHRSADMLQPCLSYNGCKDRTNLGPNLIRYLTPPPPL